MLDTKDPCTGNGPLTEEDRKRILGRIHSMLYWLGRVLPDEVELNDHKVNLRDFVNEYLQKERPTEMERQEASALSDLLKKKARLIEADIGTDGLTRKQACDMMGEVCTLLRAVDELQTSPKEEATLMHEELMKKVDDAKRWDRFVKGVK
jgi:hypothetical protein